MTFQYLFKMDKDIRFGLMLGISLPAGVLFAYMFPVTEYIAWFSNFLSYTYGSFGELWLSPLHHRGLMLLCLIGGYFMLLFAVSALSTLTLRSFRTGKFSVENVFYLVNENLIPSFFAVMLLIISVLLFHTFASLFFFMWQLILHNYIGLILAALLLLIISILYVWGLSTQVVLIPIMTYYGIKPLRAMMLSLSKSRKHSFSFMVYFFIAFLFIFGLGLLGFLVGNVWWINWILNSFSYSFAIVYVIILMYVSFFDMEGIVREDLAKKPYLRS